MPNILIFSSLQAFIISCSAELSIKKSTFCTFCSLLFWGVGGGLLYPLHSITISQWTPLSASQYHHFADVHFVCFFVEGGGGCAF